MSTSTPRLLFRNARIFDGTNADCAEGMHVLVADGLIREISAQPLAAPGAQVIDVGGRTLMPGLIEHPGPGRFAATDGLTVGGRQP